MTGRNPNVFYEVGYAHALGKIVLLLTQKADDIPFDLKHKQHIIYGNNGSKIQNLRSELNPKLIWAIDESKRKGKEDNSKQISISVCPIDKEGVYTKFTEIPEDCLSKPIPVINLPNSRCGLSFHLYNNSLQEIPNITHIYLFTDDSDSQPYIRRNRTRFVYYPSINEKFPVKYRVPITVPSIPTGAVETFDIFFDRLAEDKVLNYKLRIHISNNYYDFSFQILCMSY